MSPGVDAQAVLSLPKGGGAIRGIGETFQTNLFNGTANHSVPIAISPGRNGFGPELALAYSSGNGNGIFGLGWQLSLPRISRKTEKGLPRYDERDVFLHSGAEDLVRVQRKTVEPATGRELWVPEDPLVRADFLVYRYRPRTEGLFARIEHWLNEGTGESHWRMISRNNVTSVFGATSAARIADPANESHVFEWLLQETFDAYGNHCRYEYAADDPALELPELFEQRRAATQRYLRRIYYGNLPEPLVAANGERITYGDGAAVGHLRDGRRYAFEVLFDYGDWSTPNSPTLLPHPEPLDALELFGNSLERTSAHRATPVREDRFSNYRAGFEIRTLRRCQRVLMFHHFAELGAPTLVRSTDFEYHSDPDTRVSLLSSVTVTGYDRAANGEYRMASMPPVEFTYAQFKPQMQRFQSLHASDGRLPPMASNDPNIALIDLFGDGLPDLLRTEPDGFRYWRNLGNGLFDRPRTLSHLPAGLTLDQPGVGFGDMQGNGVADLLVSSGPLRGFFETTLDGAWKRFTPFETAPTFAPQDPNVRMVDLTGDGRADALMTDDRQFLWLECLGAQGFAKPKSIARIHDTKNFPDLFFADPENRVRLADMTGDGLNDIVLLHNGGIDYWPNLGYGRFGKRVSMSNAPRFESEFDPKRLFLADLNGTGCADLVYVDRNRVQFWFNRSGNSWSERQTIVGTPTTTDPSAVQFADIFGTGTTALVWSRDFDGASDANNQALDFCGGVKPYVLNQVDNNLGATTRVSYAPSTRFFIEDAARGVPWISRLPFPVQVVDKVESIDHVSRSKHVRTFRYHHGHYDAREREFCGFGRVDVFDTESFADFERPGLHGPDRLFDNDVAAFHLPPVETRSWFHTGIYFDDRASHTSDYRDLTERFQHEYYAADTAVVSLPEHHVDTADAPAEAYRTLRGVELRTEVYANDGSGRALHPYTVSEYRYAVGCLQPKGAQAHAVYLSHRIEALNRHYERNPDDPRIGHEMTLEIDGFGQPLRTLSIGYGRRRADPTLPTQADRDLQKRAYVTYSEFRYTNAIDEWDASPGVHVTPLLCEKLAFELTGFVPSNGRSQFSHDEWIADDFALIANAETLGYEQTPNPTNRQKRLIEHERTYFRRDDLSDLLPLGAIEPLILPGETHHLAFTEGLLRRIYDQRVDSKMLVDCGYRDESQSTWWIPSSRSFYSPRQEDSSSAELEFAKEHFFLPYRTRDPFGNSSRVARDPYSLQVTETTDALDNHTQAEHDYRHLQPFRVTDPNGNRSQIAFDPLGLVVASAIMGKRSESLGDSLDGFVPELSAEQTAAFFANPLAEAAALVGSATTRIIVDLHRFRRERQPVVAGVIARETHTSDTPASPRVQLTLEYSDGFGREIQRKSPAEPGPLTPDGPAVDARWVASGWTVFNNKGNPVRRYEPFFDTTPEFRFNQRAGVSALLLYDAAERVVATLHPNHAWEKTAFTAWQRSTWDVNDTVLIEAPQNDGDVGVFIGALPQSEYLPTWFQARATGALGDVERAVASKTREHAATPTITHTDSLGRAFLNITHNRVSNDAGPQDQLLADRVTYDIEGNLCEVFDAGDRLVTRFDYDMLGTRTVRSGMDSGSRWVLNDIGGQPAFVWDSRGHIFRHSYDRLRRPTATYLKDSGSPERLVSRSVYGESIAAAELANLRGRTYQQFDQAGVQTHERYDFKGNPLIVNRQFAENYRATLDWSQNPALLAEVFSNTIVYDALNRCVRQIAPDGSVTTPQFNAAGSLERLDVQLLGQGTATAFVSAIERDAKGQRTRIDYGNGVRTLYDYDPLTLRLLRRRTLRGADGVQDLRYTYDPIGNIVAIADDAQQTLYFNNQVVGADADYTYDPLYRLIVAEGREHIGKQPIRATTWHDNFRQQLPQPGDGRAMRRYREQYGYDSIGNIQSLTHRVGSKSWVRRYHYREASGLEPAKLGNRLSSVATDKHRQQAYPYDSHGNMTAMPHLAAMEWDFHDRLRSVSRGNSTSYYVYGGDGRRVRKIVEKNGGALIEERISLGAFEVFRRRKSDGTLTLERQTLHVMDANERVAMVETRTHGKQLHVPAQGIRYQLGNHLGSAALELDENGDLISYEEYYPYGSTSYQAGRTKAEVSLKRYRFSGMERDEETGLNFHGARFYAPWLARWTSCDPADTADHLNLYVYCRNNPTNLVDPNGFESKKRGARGDVNTHGAQGSRGKGTPGQLESEHMEPIAAQREDMRNPRTGRSPIPEGRGSQIDRSQPTVMLDKATADAKTAQDRGVINRAKAEARTGNISPATAQALTPEGAMARAEAAARATGTTLPAGAQAAAIGQTDSKHADPAVRAFSRDPANNPLVGATDAEISAAIDAPVGNNAQRTGDMTSLAATKDPNAKTVFKGNYSEVRPPPPAAPAAPAEPATAAAPTSPPAAQGSALKAGVKAGATTLAFAGVFLGANYLVHKKLRSDLESSVAQMRSGSQGWARHVKQEHPTQPVYFSFMIESRESSYFLPLVGWMPNPPELHVIQFAVTNVPVTTPTVSTQSHFGFFTASTTTRVTYTELAIP